MRTTIILLFSIMQFALYGYDTTYYAVLRKAIKQMDSEYRFENFQQLANTCERIMAVKPDEWLPIYYRAYAFLKMGELTTDEDKKDGYFDKAQITIDLAFKLNIKESELCVLQAYIYYSKMGINSMIRGPIYYSKAKDMLEKAEELNINNPRVYYLRGSSLMYTPEFLGGGKEAAKPVIEKAIKLFSDYSPLSDIHPNWGQSDCERLKKKIEVN